MNFYIKVSITIVFIGLISFSLVAPAQAQNYVILDTNETMVIKKVDDEIHQVDGGHFNWSTALLIVGGIVVFVLGSYLLIALVSQNKPKN